MESIKEDIRNNKFGLYSNTRILSNYQRTLLYPNASNMAKIPGTFARRSIVKRVYSTKTITTNANGHLGLVYEPYVSNGADTNTTFIITNDAAYNPASAPAAVTQTALESSSVFLVDANTTRQSRIVGLTLKCYSLSTALNRTGTVYGALLHTTPLAQAPIGALAASSFFTIPSIQNCVMKRANVANGEGVIIANIPSDDDDLQFYPTNTYPTTRHTNGDDAYIMVVICSGLQASSTVRVEIETVFEIIPLEGSTLAGLETEAPKINTIPALEIGQVRNFHTGEMVRIIGAYEGTQINMVEPVGNSKIAKGKRQPIRTKGGDYYTINGGPGPNLPVNDFGGFNPLTMQKNRDNNLVKNVVKAMIPITQAAGLIPSMFGGKRNLRTAKKKLRKPKRVTK